MRHWLDVVEIATGFRNLDAAGHFATTIERFAGRVGHVYTIYQEEVIVKTRYDGSGCYAPHALLILLHLELIADADMNLYLLGFGRFDAEHHSLVGQEARVAITIDIG